MKAEEYLETRRCNSAISNKFDICYMDAAYEAIKMAREEEREKAIKALKTVYEDCDKCDKSDSTKCGYECIENKFKELLDKEI